MLITLQPEKNVSGSYTLNNTPSIHGALLHVDQTAKHWCVSWGRPAFVSKACWLYSVRVKMAKHLRPHLDERKIKCSGVHSSRVPPGDQKWAWWAHAVMVDPDHLESLVLTTRNERFVIPDATGQGSFGCVFPRSILDLRSRDWRFLVFLVFPFFPHFRASFFSV